jgi:hypothetical protein
LKATTCGVIRQWWFTKTHKVNSLDMVGDSFLRAISFSFGSVCLGSLFIGPANFLRQIAGYIRPNKEEAAISVFVIVQELIVSIIDYTSVKFSNWAFAYVGEC